MADARKLKLEQVLRQVPYEYANKDRLRRDVQNLLHSCHTLTPEVQSFQGAGKTARLFYLFGVLPITYQGNTYNIPVTIYFDAPYPKAAPRCFVTPTSGMSLKPNNPNVDNGGMIYIPYLTEWNERTSTLTELVTVLISIFTQTPPCYATPGGATATATAAASTAAAAQPEGSPLENIGAALGRAFTGLGLGGGQSQPAPAMASAYPAHQASIPNRAVPVAQATPVVTPVVVRQGTAGVQPTLLPMSRKEELVVQCTQGLQERWPKVLKPLVDDANEQLKLKAELQQDVIKVQEDIAGLETAHHRRDEVQAELRRAETSLREFVTKNGSREMNPDELRDTIDPDSRLVLDSLAEELSLDEFLQALDDLLSAHKISTDDFVREVRDVGRRQFMCKVQRSKAQAACQERPAADPVSRPLRVAVAA